MKATVIFTRNPLRTAFIAIAVLFCFASLNAQLAGTYRIGPPDSTNLDFTSFGEIADTLNKSGISDSVVINILPGTYTGVHITIDTVDGAAADKWVVFQSSTGDSTDVTLSYNYPDDINSNWMIRLRGVNYMTFKHMSFTATAGDADYGRIIVLSHNSSNINIQNNALYGKEGDYYNRRDLIHAHGTKTENILVEYNLLNKGEDAVSLVGKDNTDLSSGNVIRFNTMQNQYGQAIYLENQNAPIISDNDLDIDPEGKTAIYMAHCDNTFRVINNIVDIENPIKAVHLYRCDGIISSEGRIANNFIGVYITGNENTGLCLQDCDYVQVFHNSIDIYSGWKTDSRCLYSYSGGAYQDIRNNIFQNYAGGYAAFLESTGAISNSNNNDYWTNGNYLVKWGSSDIKDLAAFQTTRSPFDNASISTRAVFASRTPVDHHTTHYLLKDAGADLVTPLYVTTDIDGDGRSTTPCIGPDEFATATGAALTGTITVGSDQEITSISHIVDSMNLYGIAGDVTINIMDNGSPYQEYFTISSFPGADSDNRVTIQADPSNENDVIIQYNDAGQTQNYVLRFLRGSYTTVKDLTFAAGNASYPNVIHLAGNCAEDSILNCTLTTAGGQSGNVINSSGYEIHDLAIVGNTISDGDRAISITGLSGSNAQNLSVSGNSLISQYGRVIFLEYCSAPEITNNTIDTRTYTYYGRSIYTLRCHGGATITGNTILSRYSSFGIYLEDCDGSFGSENLIANNVVSILGSNDDATHGIYTKSSNYVNVYFNTVRISSGMTNDGANAFINENGAHLKVKNNIFANFGDGRAYYHEQSDALDESNNNILHASRLYLARWGSSEKATLAEWQSVSGGEDNLSLEMNPGFVSAEDLHTYSSFIDGAGDNSTGITTDIDGVSRSDPPDIGAYEFSTLFTPMSGDYFVYGTGPDFSTIGQAFDSLQYRGVSGPVRLLVRNGTWEERIGGLIDVPGSCLQNIITLESESGNPDSVIIHSPEANSIMWFLSVNNFIIKGLTLNTTNTGGGQPFSAAGYLKNIQFLNNKLVNSNSAGTNILISNCIADSIIIKDNTLDMGYRGIQLQGSTNHPATNTEIIGNTIKNSRDDAVFLRYHTSPIINSNDIQPQSYRLTSGLRIQECHGPLEISGNKINITSSSYGGIILQDCHATSSFSGLVSNNMIRTGNMDYNSFGIYCNSSEYQNIYHNSILCTHTHSSYIGKAIYIYSTANVGINIVNNVIANKGNGWALDIDQTSDVGIVDNNCYWANNSSRLVEWGGTAYGDLVSLQNATTKNVSSIEAEPMFFSYSDLHSSQRELHKAATPLAEVTIDIDSVLRDTEFPDIGAAEFTCGPPEVDLSISITCKGDTTMIIDNSSNIAPGSKIGWDWDGDYFADEYSTQLNDTIYHYFGTAGDHPFVYLVDQIADNPGCDVYPEMTATIFAPPALEISTQGAYCDTNDGAATVDVTNSDGSFDHFWSNDSTGASVTGLALGTYTVAVSDTNGCTTTQELTIGEAIQVTVTQLQPSTCGVPDGSAFVTATGGVEPYNFMWSNGESAEDVLFDTNFTLSPGTHYVNAIDANGCYAQGSIIMANDGTGPQVTAAAVVGNDCYGDRDGNIDINVASDLPYTIKWSNGETSEDIGNLAAGIYNVVVTDSVGCIGAGSFEVTQPSKISANITVTDANCAGSDGQAVTTVIGGTLPYNYQWSDNASVFSVAQGLSAGVYTLTITDGKGCQHIEPFIINDIGGPTITVDSVYGVGCTVTDNGAIYTTRTGGTPIFSISWDGPLSVPNSFDITGLVAGTYEITVTDGAGCKGVARAEVKQEPPAMNPICMVTVDDSTQTNQVVWEKVATEDISHYNIYRETATKGVYQLIGSQPAESLSVFTDSVADPSVRSWRYKISAVDLCDIESELSPHHKTIHLTMNVGFVGNTVNLIWDEYEGFNALTYNLNRVVGVTPVSTISSQAADDFNSYTDDVAAIDDDIIYYVEVLHPGAGCTATESKASTLNSTRSNRKNKSRATGIGPLFELYNLSIYPNPGTGIFNLEMDLATREDLTVRVYDVTGKLVLLQEYPNRSYELRTQLDLSEVPAGIYNVHITTSRTFLHRVLVKQ